MHGIKGAWVGQTFALANHHESQGRTEGRKSRIRRSKEERKAMVETFIKMYQDSNNGNFPSLNLTHKEVGGSFYTVREIVRDIIQENRVLGPSKFMAEEQSNDQSLKHYSLVSIATDLQDPLITKSNQIQQEPDKLQGVNEDLSSIQTEIIQETSEDQSHSQTSDFHHSNENQIHLEAISLKSTDEEMITISNGQVSASGYLKDDDGQIANCSQMILTNAECSETKSSELQVNLSLPEEKNVEKEMAELEAKISPLTADVIVETFPIRPVTTLTDNVVEVQAKGTDMNNFSHEKLKMVSLEEGNGNFSLEQDKSVKSLDFVDGRAMDDSLSILWGEKSISRHKEVVGDVHSSFESPKQLEEHANEFEGYEHLESKVAVENTTTHRNLSEALAGTETTHPQTAVNAKNLNGTCIGVANLANAGKEIASKKAEVQPDLVSIKKSNPTLDRINLESWDGKTKRPVKTESNPLMAVLKAFVDAFVRFWSE